MKQYSKEGKGETEEQQKKQKKHIQKKNKTVHVNTTTSIITLKINEWNTPIKGRDCQTG